MRRPLNPRLCSVAIDANALDRCSIERAALVDRLLDLHIKQQLRLVVPHSVLSEVQRPQTPSAVRCVFSSQIYTIKVSLTAEERRTRQIIEDALQGNAKPGKHAADAQHLAEAAKYSGYFITYDDRILNRSAGLSEVLPPSLNIVNLTKFFEIYDKFAPA